MLTQRGLLETESQPRAAKHFKLIDSGKPATVQWAIRHDDGKALISALTNLYFEHYQKDYRKPNLSRLLASEIRFIRKNDIVASGELVMLLNAMSHVIRLCSDKVDSKDACHGKLAKQHDNYLGAIDLLVKLRYEFVRALAGRGLLNNKPGDTSELTLTASKREKMRNIVVDAVSAITERISQLKTATGELVEC